jgi:hypothetical protein
LVIFASMKHFGITLIVLTFTEMAFPVPKKSVILPCKSRIKPFRLAYAFLVVAYFNHLDQCADSQLIPPPCRWGNLAIVWDHRIDLRLAGRKSNVVTQNVSASFLKNFTHFPN